MASDWLLEAAAQYNEQSLEGRDGYPAYILMPVDTLAQILDWTFQSLPDEILVGMDVNPDLPHSEEIEKAYCGIDFESGLFSGQGFSLGEPHLVNRGDSYSVHHVPEEWMDGLSDKERGV